PGLTFPSASTTVNAGVVAGFMERLIEGNPHTSTKTERMANGIHALNTLPAEYERGLTYLSKSAAAHLPPTSSIICGSAEAGGVALSSSKRQMFLGFQNRRKATVTTIATTALMMSTRLLSTWFD